MSTIDTDALDRADMGRLRAGEAAALNDLMERHATGVFHFLFRMLGNEDDAEDLAQETFTRVYRYNGSFVPGARFSTWLYTIAGNLARNHHRWRARHPNLSLEAPAGASEQTVAETLPAPEALPSETAIASERAFAIRTAVARLPDDLREALILCEWEELPVAEAAVVLNSTAKAVESRLYRARQLLRRQLASWL